MVSCLQAFIATLLVLSGTALSLTTNPASRTPISSQRIAEVLQGAGMDVKAGQIEALSNVTSAHPAPGLRVVSLEIQDPTTARVKLRCEMNRECIPFYVLVHSTGDDFGPVVNDWARAHGRVHPQAQSQEEVLVRSGQQVMLYVTSGHLRITLPVRCLQNGVRGQEIKVSTTERKKKTYVARVVSAEVVTSTTLN
jgi:hypothetical protein